ncbi:hypothetical protein SD80_000645 [Scytonema tolypothrichoides VB-61278]|nr:hypothetical protein SD80_000645 [Scytonema tolypothrichoides VB-61278]
MSLIRIIEKKSERDLQKGVVVLREIAASDLLKAREHAKCVIVSRAAKATKGTKGLSVKKKTYMNY